MQPVFKAAALLALAEAELRAGRAEEGRRWAESAIRVLGGATSRGGGLRLGAVGQMLIGVAFMQQGQYDDALKRLEGARVDFGKSFGPEHAATQLFALNNALALAGLNRVPEALEVVQHAEPVLRQAFGAEAPTYQVVLALMRRLQARSAQSSVVDDNPDKQRKSRDPTPPAIEFFS